MYKVSHSYHSTPADKTISFSLSEKVPNKKGKVPQKYLHSKIYFDGIEYWNPVTKLLKNEVIKRVSGYDNYQFIKEQKGKTSQGHSYVTVKLEKIKEKSSSVGKIGDMISFTLLKHKKNNSSLFISFWEQNLSKNKDLYKERIDVREKLQNKIIDSIEFDISLEYLTTFENYQYDGNNWKTFIHYGDEYKVSIDTPASMKFLGGDDKYDTPTVYPLGFRAQMSENCDKHCFYLKYYGRLQKNNILKNKDIKLIKLKTSNGYKSYIFVDEQFTKSHAKVTIAVFPFESSTSWLKWEWTPSMQLIEKYNLNSYQDIIKNSVFLKLLNSIVIKKQP